MTPQALADAVAAGAARLKGAAVTGMSGPRAEARVKGAEGIAGLKKRLVSRTTGENEHTQLFGLDRRPRPASMRQRILIGLRRSAPFSSLQRRIIFFNLIGLAVLVFGVLYLNQFRTGLIEQRFQSLSVEGQIIAVTIAESAATFTDGEIVSALERPGLDPDRASSILTSLSRPARVRARLYDTDLRLIADTRSAASGLSTISRTRS
ncbi:MAG: stimulus-sensing domain-containing protein, partial [Pseudomonadota bacterium]